MSPSPIYHFIPEEETYERCLLFRLSNCRQSILASAFFTFGAFQSMRQTLQEALKDDAEIKFLLGRFDFVTEPRAVDALLRLSRTYPEQLNVYFDSDFGFHYKLAIFKSGQKEAVLIGSSNLTPKGLRSEGEANLEIAGNRSVYRQAQELLRDRIKHAIPAEDAIDDYRRRYNRAKRYRQNRSKWIARGQKAWMPKRRVSPHYAEPEGNRFVICWLTDWEKDKNVLKNTQKEHTNAKVKGQAFPNQWISVANGIARVIKEGEYFVVSDDLGYSLGFAVCTRKIKVLDEKDRRKSIIFYRFRRGWKAQFSSRTKYQQALKQLRFRDSSEIGPTVSRRLKGYLQSRHN